MGLLNVLGGIGAIILTVELVIFTLIFLAVCAGLAFGLRYARGKTAWAFDKTHTLTRQAITYEHKGVLLAVKPFIMGSALGETVVVIVRRLWADMEKREQRP